MASFLTHFGLSRHPFDKDLLDADLWLPPSKGDLVEEAVEALRSRESLLLFGECGVGKTCTLRLVRHRLSSEGFRLTYCHNAFLGRRDFYRQVCRTPSLPDAATAGALVHTLADHVHTLHKERLHPVLLLDEAHLLPQETLDVLPLLLNYDWDSLPLLSLVLIGLPELHDRLVLRRNRALYSRLSRRLRIEPLSPDDTAQYLRTRLRRAGAGLKGGLGGGVVFIDAVILAQLVPEIGVLGSGGQVLLKQRLALVCRGALPHPHIRPGVAVADSRDVDRVAVGLPYFALAAHGERGDDGDDAGRRSGHDAGARAHLCHR